ncbi:MAG: amidohydrolase family protein [Lachnospiraceae bacterium]|nr:amidohydrolase family protein [Lachnospiraceae bacterium]
MIIDFHTHTFPDKIASKAIDKLSHEAHIIPHRDGTASSLASTSAASGVDLSVILPVATSPGQVERINDTAALLNESQNMKEPGALLSFASIHPDYAEPKKEILRIKEHGFKGIKIHPVYQNTDIDDIRFLRIISLAAEQDLIVVTHAGLDIGFPGRLESSPDKCKKVLDEIGSFKFVLAHMGGWKNWEDVKTLLSGYDIWLDSAFSTGEIEPLTDGYWDDKDKSLLSPEGFMEMVQIFGLDRILFGTDSPWSDQKKSMDFIKNLPLSDKEKNMILGENAKNLLSLRQCS